MEKYGPLQNWAIYGSNLIAVVFALRTALLGKALWEPTVDDFPRAPVRISGLGGVLVLAIVFALSRKHPDIDQWIKVAAIVFIPLLVLFLCDIVLRQWLIIRCGTAKPVIGGLWLTPRARAILRGDAAARQIGDLAADDPPPPSAAALYCSFVGPRDKTRVWPPASTAFATALIVGVYCLWNVLAVAGIVIAATLVVLSV